MLPTHIKLIFSILRTNLTKPHLITKQAAIENIEEEGVGSDSDSEGSTLEEKDGGVMSNRTWFQLQKNPHLDPKKQTLVQGKLCLSVKKIEEQRGLQLGAVKLEWLSALNRAAGFPKLEVTCLTAHMTASSVR